MSIYVNVPADAGSVEQELIIASTHQVDDRSACNNLRLSQAILIAHPGADSSGSIFRATVVHAVGLIAVTGNAVTHFES